MHQRLFILIAIAATTMLNARSEVLHIGDLYYQVITPSYSDHHTLEVMQHDSYAYLTAITIPDSVKHLGTTFTVTSIGDQAFANCTSLRYIKIPTSITHIGWRVFKNCPSLRSITIPCSVETIGDYDFEWTNSQTTEPEVLKYEIADTDFFLEEELEIEIPEVTPIEEEEEEVIFWVVETMPEFPGGQQALFKYIADSLHYPVIAQENGIQGRVICQFVVEKDGSITAAVVTRSSGEPALDKEALRLVNAMPKWKPGKQRGKPVRVKYTIPVNFRL
jgi:TonB family protein